jgi:putative endonuclease
MGRSNRQGGRAEGAAALARGRRAEGLVARLLVSTFNPILGHREKTSPGERDRVALSPKGGSASSRSRRVTWKERPGRRPARQRDRIIPAGALYLNARPGLRHKGIRFDAILVLPRRLPASRQRRVAAGIQIVKFVMRWPKERCT